MRGKNCAVTYLVSATCILAGCHHVSRSACWGRQRLSKVGSHALSRHSKFISAAHELPLLNMLQYEQHSAARALLRSKAKMQSSSGCASLEKHPSRLRELRYQGILIFHALSSFDPSWHVENPDLVYSVLPSRMKGRMFRDEGTEGRFHPESKAMAMCMMQYFQSTKKTHPEKACTVLFKLTRMLDVRTSQNFSFICRFIDDQVCTLGCERMHDCIIAASLKMMRVFRESGADGSDVSRETKVRHHSCALELREAGHAMAADARSN